jgi:long-chain acyl-CoA synthetase
MLSHGNIVSNILNSLTVLKIDATDSCLSFLPLCHIFERMAGHYTTFHCGTTIAYAESIDAVPQNLAEVQPTFLVSVPRIYEKVHARVLDTVAKSSPLRQKLFHWGVEVGRRRSLRLLAGQPVPPWLEFQYSIASELVFSKLRQRMGGHVKFMVSGGAPLGASLALFFHAAGLTIIEGYGLTETSPVISCNRLERIKLGTVGQPIPGMEVRIADDGEILVKGPGVMLGYFKDPAATAAAIDNGWFHTGDIGFLDPDGFLTITDRKKDLLVTAGGKNVAPQPIENRLKQDAWITEAVLIGDRRPYCIALIVPDFARLTTWARAEGLPGDVAALCADPRVLEMYMSRLAPINAELASFESIKRIGLIDRELTVAAGDLTPTLKLKRRVLAERFGPQIEAIYAAP